MIKKHQYGFVQQISVMGCKINKKIEDLKHSSLQNGRVAWVPITMFFVTHLTANTQRHTIVLRNGIFDGGSHSMFKKKKLKNKSNKIMI